MIKSSGDKIIKCEWNEADLEPKDAHSTSCCTDADFSQKQHKVSHAVNGSHTESIAD